MAVSIRTLSRRPDKLLAREWWCEEMDGDTQVDCVLVMGCCNAEYAADEAAEYFDNNSGGDVERMTVRVESHLGECTTWKMTSEYSKDWYGEEQAATAAGGES